MVFGRSPEGEMRIFGSHTDQKAKAREKKEKRTDRGHGKVDRRKERGNGRREGKR